MKASRSIQRRQTDGRQLSPVRQLFEEVCTDSIEWSSSNEGCWVDMRRRLPFPPEMQPSRHLLVRRVPAEVTVEQPEEGLATSNKTYTQNSFSFNNAAVTPFNSGTCYTDRASYAVRSPPPVQPSNPEPAAPAPATLTRHQRQLSNPEPAQPLSAERPVIAAVRKSKPNGGGELGIRAVL